MYKGISFGKQIIIMSYSKQSLDEGLLNGILKVLQIQRQYATALKHLKFHLQEREIKIHLNYSVILCCGYYSVTRNNRMFLTGQ